MWLRFGRRVVVKVLSDHPLAQIELPSDDEMVELCAVIAEKYPSLRDVWGARDGLKVYLERTGEEDVQNMFWNGWQHSHFVNCLFLFLPDGRIRLQYINAPGTCHNSTMAIWGNIYDKIDEVYQRTLAKVVIDFAFGKEQCPSLIKSHQENFDGQGRQRQQYQVHQDATSVRQLSEWGMRGLQGSFPRLKDRMLYEERGERKVILNMITLLFNF